MVPNNKFKFRLKFFVVTNYRPLFIKKMKSRYRFLRLFLIFLFFLVLFIKNKNNKSRTLKNKNSYLKKIQTKLFFLNENILINQPNNLFLKKTKPYFINNNPKFYKSIKKLFFLHKVQNLEDFKFNFIIFTKFYSHFVVLRAPFRDKISKNLLQHQRFFLYINFIFLKYTPSFFPNKIYFFWFLKNFHKLTPFYSNLFFINSQKISFFTHIPYILNKN